MNNQFGSKIRLLREEKKLCLGQIAPMLEMDTAQLSKIEKGMRQIKKEQIKKLVNICKADKTELESFWLADQVIEVMKNSNAVLQALNVAGNQIENRNKN